MKKIFPDGISVVYLFWFLANCSSPTPQPPAEVEIGGQVFIVTKGRTNVKLGLVDIIVIEEALMIEFMNLKKQNATAEIEAYSKKISQECLDEIDRLGKEYKAAIASWEINWKSGTATKKMEDAEKRLKSKRAEFAQIPEKTLRYSIVDRWFLGLPNPIKILKTDADGNFILRIKPGRYALVAEEERQTLKETEEYRWLVWIDVKDGEMERILLSNDNVIETFCADCVIKPEDIVI